EPGVNRTLEQITPTGGLRDGNDHLLPVLAAVQGHRGHGADSGKSAKPGSDDVLRVGRVDGDIALLLGPAGAVGREHVGVGEVDNGAETDRRVPQLDTVNAVIGREEKMAAR